MSTAAHEWAPHPFRPELSRLIDAGVLARAALDDGERVPAFEVLARATRRGDLTAGQAGAIAALLGLSGACRPASAADEPRRATDEAEGAKR